MLLLTSSMPNDLFHWQIGDTEGGCAVTKGNHIMNVVFTRFNKEHRLVYLGLKK